MPSGFVLPMSNLGSAGMFIGILSAFIAVEIYRFTQKSGFKISMPPQFQHRLRVLWSFNTNSYRTITCFNCYYVYRIDVHKIVGRSLPPLVQATDSIFSVIVVILFITIHSGRLVFTVGQSLDLFPRPLWLVLLEENTSAFASGSAIPNIAAEPFYQWFVMIGGSGGYWLSGLAILLIWRSKSAYGKSLGKTAFIPAVCNINEPLIFGTLY